MQKPLADKLAYEFAKARFQNSDYMLSAVTARQVAEFIKTLSSELQKNADDFQAD